MLTSDWKKVAECKFCLHLVDAFGLAGTSGDVCPNCGERRSYSGTSDNLWTYRTAKGISLSVWWKPKTWGSGEILFKNGETVKVVKGKMIRDSILEEELV